MTFVLVHGAFFGGWCWGGVVKQLISKNFEVFAPTLPGVSDRCDEFSGSIDLNDHVTEIVNLIEENNLTDVHLVSWSYGGMVITGVLGAMPARIRQLTYVDAHLPEHKKSAASYLNAGERLLLNGVSLLGIGITPPDPRKWGVENESLLADIAPRLSSQPPRTFTQPVQAPDPWPSDIDYSYIRCRGYAGSVFDQFYERAVADRRFRTSEVQLSHAAVLTHPSEIAHALVGV